VVPAQPCWHLCILIWWRTSVRQWIALPGMSTHPVVSLKSRSRPSATRWANSMRVEFLGTAAAEAFPDPFCDCDYCEASRIAGGKRLRLRASALINDDLIIDLGPDLHVAAFRRGK